MIKKAKLSHLSIIRNRSVFVAVVPCCLLPSMDRGRVSHGDEDDRGTTGDDDHDQAGGEGETSVLERHSSVKVDAHSILFV